jgi:hypothetical protein
MKDSKRNGYTVKPFNEKESWDLLLRLLGPSWQTRALEKTIPESEIRAAQVLLVRIGGLALAIEQAATMIKDATVGGSTIKTFLEYFDKCYRELPPRQKGEREKLIHALDTVWSMASRKLSPNGVSLLGVLALLSPDSIRIDLFLPRNQNCLDGVLSFCKQQVTAVGGTRVALSTIATPSPDMYKALGELVQSNLIKRDGRLLSMHRVVQEAMSYQHASLWKAFDAAVQIMYEAFPKQIDGDPLHNVWPHCELHIQHGLHLAHKYADFVSKGLGARATFKAPENFTALLGNCAW